MEFNERLMELRKQKGMSQEDLGYELGVSRQTVSKWELGETTPEMSKLVAMSNLFNVSLDSLIKGENAYTHYSKNEYGYEYKSKQTLWGVPVVHINLGGRGGKFRKAKGIVAIGDLAAGIVAIGGLSIGVVAIGGLSLGIAALGGMAVAIAALGGMSIGYMAIGGVALGYMAIGGVAAGVNAIGGAAIAKDIALGGAATGTIAIGDNTKGTITFNTLTCTAEKFRNAVSLYLPNAKGWVIRLFEKIISMY